MAAMEKVDSDTEVFLRFAEDGTVSAGNLEGLVSRVIDGRAGSSAEDHFKATFLTTYQLFSTSARLFEILKRRFEAADLDPADTQTQHSYVNNVFLEDKFDSPSLRILLFIESWIKKGFEDEELTCSSKIRGFVLAISGPEELKAKAAEIANTIFDPDYVGRNRLSTVITPTGHSGLPPPTKERSLDTIQPYRTSSGDEAV